MMKPYIQTQSTVANGADRTAPAIASQVMSATLHATNTSSPTNARSAEAVTKTLLSTVVATNALTRTYALGGATSVLPQW